MAAMAWARHTRKLERWRCSAMGMRAGAAAAVVELEAMARVWDVLRG